MAGFWNSLAKGLTAIALWAASHPQIVQEVVASAIQAHAQDGK